MRSNYLKPTVQILFIETNHMVAVSGEGVLGSNGLGYGGVDAGGSKDPSVKNHHNLWDEEW